MDDLQWLVREHLGEEAEVLMRDSSVTGRAGAAAGMLGGGLRPDEVARAVRRTKARIVHAHNLQPTFGWRALGAARAAGAAVVMHVHQYRLVCAIGVCFRSGHECTRCHGRNTLPGVLLNCRGSRPEAVVYGAGLALWQRRLAARVDAFVVPSRFAEARLRAIGAPLGETHVVPNVIRTFASSPARAGGGPALLVGRLAPEKGIDVAIQACRIAAIPLVVAGAGPARARPAEAAGPGVTFLGRVAPEHLARLRREASVALVPSLSAETFGLAAAEAMAAGLPVVASRVGALPELVPDDWLVAPGDPGALATAIQRVRAEPDAGHRAVQHVQRLLEPGTVAAALREAYSAADRARRRRAAA